MCVSFDQFQFSVSLRSIIPGLAATLPFNFHLMSSHYTDKCPPPHQWKNIEAVLCFFMQMTKGSSLLLVFQKSRINISTLILYFFKIDGLTASWMVEPHLQAREGALLNIKRDKAGETESHLIVFFCFEFVFCRTLFGFFRIVFSTFR